MDHRAGAAPVFIGRDREVAELLAGLDDAVAGYGRLFLLGGEPGIGKSRLADEVASRARQHGIAVASGRCWEAGGAPPYWPWVQVMRAYLRGRDAEAVRQAIGVAAVDVAQLLPEIRGSFAGLPAPPTVDADSARFQLFDSTTSFLLRAAAREPFVVVLEDLHAADTPSLLLLQFLAGQMGDSRLLVVGTYRDIALTPDHPMATTLRELSREPSTRRINLVGLSEADVARLVAATHGLPLPPRLISALHRETNGNPLFVGEAVRLLAVEGKLSQLSEPFTLRVPVPKGVRDVIGRRLDHLDAACREVLLLASVLGTDFTTEALGRLSGMPSDQLLDIIDHVVEAGLLRHVPGALGRLRFSHGLVRETLYDELTSAQRMRLHHQAAEALAGLYAGDEESHLAELAHHFFEAAPLGDTATAVDYARRAGAEATRALAYEEAARLYRMALAALELDMRENRELQGELLLSLGDALARAGDLLAARETLLSAATNARRSGAASRLAQAALGYGGRFPWARAGDDPHLVPLLQDALVLLGGDDDRLRVRLLARLAGALRSSPDRDRSDTLSRQALDIARRLGDPATLGYALVSRCWAIWWPENPHERLDLATELIRVGEAANDAERVLDGHMARSGFLAELGAIAEARTELQAMARKVEELRQPAQAWMARTTEPIGALLEGAFDRAETVIESEMRPGLPPTLARDDVSAHHMHLFLLGRERGGLAELEDGTRAAVDQLPWYPVHRAALTCLLVELGRHDEARAVFDELAVGGFRVLYRDSEWLLGMALASEACFGLRDVERATTLYEQLLPFDGRHAIAHAEGSVGAVSRYLGLLAQTLSQLDDAERHLRDAVAMNERMRARPWTAHARFDIATVLLERDGPGDRERATVELQMAAEACEELGMPALAGKVARRLRDLDVDERPEPAVVVGPTVFRREGEFWTVVFATDAFRLKDAKGLRYLAYLLQRPGHEVHVLDLAAVEAGAAADRSKGPPTRDDELHAGRLSDAGPVLDERAKASYRERLLELEDDLNEATAWSDSVRATRIRAEMDFLAEELAAAVGLGGRDRNAGSPAERARVNITRAIKAALVRIRDHSTTTADHLDATIHTGTFCSYSPDPRAPITWHT